MANKCVLSHALKEFTLPADVLLDGSSLETRGAKCCTLVAIQADGLAKWSMSAGDHSRSDRINGRSDLWRIPLGIFV